ncbi:MAG: VWA domain-containing protein [Clostridiales bacterium]|nr:VWA domain-containing protein [Clostridiales bacterium]
MQFVNLLPFGLLVLIPGIILLYILKQKSEDKDVSSLYLWRETYKNIEVSSPWERLKNNLLMYIQIAVILGIILALAGPYLANSQTGSKNMVLVLDNSGSMNAIYTEKKSRLETAKEEALHYVEKWNGNVNVTLLSCNQNSKVILSGCSDTNKIKEAIYNINPTDVAGNLEPAVSMVESMAEQWDGYEALFFTDSSLNMGKVNGNVVDVSSKGMNGAVDYVSYDRGKNGSISVVSKVTNYGTETTSSDVNLYFNDKMLRIENSGELAPGESTVVYFEPVTAKEYENNKTVVIRAEWNQKDAMENDNAAYTIMRENEEQKVLLISKQNVFLEKAIGTLDHVSLYKADSMKEAEGSGEYDLYIFDNVMPEEIPDGNLLFINPKDSNITKDLFQVKGKKKGAVVNICEQKYTQMIDKKFNFGVNQYQQIEPVGKAEVFLQADKDKVGFLERIGKRQIAVLGFDLHASDFALQMEFPILMNQLLGDILQGYMLQETQIIAGEEYLVNQVSYTKEQAGIYTIEGETTKGKVQESLAVNFPTTAESSLVETVEVSQNESAQTKNVTDTIRNTRDLKTFIIWLVLVLVGLEWVIYLRNR